MVSMVTFFVHKGHCIHQGISISIERPCIHEGPYRLRHLLCPDRGNDVKTAKDDSLGLIIHELMHVLINIVEELFGPLFPRHQSGYNKRCNWLNKLLRIQFVNKVWVIWSERLIIFTTGMYSQQLVEPIASLVVPG